MSIGTDLAVPEAVLDPRTGELIPAAEVPRVAVALGALRDFKRQVGEAIKQAEAVLIAESERQGTKTLRFGKTEVTIAGGSEVVWDIEELQHLLAEGLPQERYDELVTLTVDYKVDARVAKQLEASNPTYAEIIERARTRVEKPRYARVKGGTT